MRAFTVFGSCLCLAGCATGSDPSSSTAAEAALPGAGRQGSGDNSGLLRPDQIDAILRESKRTYRVRANASVEASPLTNILPESPLEEDRRLDPFLEVSSVDGRPRLRSVLPDEELEPIFSRASDAFQARDYDTARRLYAEAIRVRPVYFKSYTYLGNALYFLGRYVEAEAAFEKALELNPFDYQAHLFLGDTHHQLGHYRRAKAELTLAFMLNRENEVVRERLDSTLAKLGLAVRDDRLTPRIRIEPDHEGGVLIRLDESHGTRWYALAACLACWSYEDACKTRSTPSEDPLQLAMYRECLLNQAASIAVRRDNERALATDERALLTAIESGYLEAIVFWEVVAARAPAVMLLVPEGLRDDILDYIDRYVFVSTRVVDGAPSLEARFASR